MKHLVPSEMIIPWTENARNTMSLRANVVTCLIEISQTNFENNPTQMRIKVFPVLL
jgi:hypothetical protein